MVFVDRKAKYPGRWTMKKSDGTSEIVTLVRNDEPEVEGTPMNAETLNTLSDVAGADVARIQAEAARDAAAGSATQAAGSASAATESKTAAATSEANAAKHEEAAKKAAEEAGAKAGTDKTLSIENAPADAAVVGRYILDQTKDTPELAFYSKAETDAKIKELLAKQREEDYARIKFWASNDPTSPASFIGGTWERIEGKFIMGASDTYPAGSTGGSAAIHISKTNLPNVRIFTQTIHPGSTTGTSYDTVTTSGGSDGNSYFSRTGRTDPLGDGAPLDILPPYYSVYIWRRVA